jgi:DNA-binding CsgD family transcriptional regulator
LAPGNITEADRYIETLGQFLEDLQSTASLECNAAIESLRVMFESAIQKLGFKHFTYHIVHSHAYGNGTGRLPLIISNYPEIWIDHYFRNRYLDDDPVVGNFLENRQPFLWSSLNLPEDLSRRQRQLLSEARDAGITDGFTLPAGGNTEIAAVSLVSDTAGGGDIQLIGRTQQLLSLMIQQYHLLARRALIEKALIGDSSRRRSLLSPREKEVLKWAAAGKSNWEIATLLKVSEKGIEFHFDNVKNKLQVFNRTHAIIKAITLGLLVLD